MLSTQYRLRLEFICKCIANGEEVKLSDMIWANKLAKANTTAHPIIKRDSIVLMISKTGFNRTAVKIGDSETNAT